MHEMERPEADAQEQRHDEAGAVPDAIPADVPEGDALEQHDAAAPTATPSPGDADAAEGDAAEQQTTDEPRDGAA